MRDEIRKLIVNHQDNVAMLGRPKPTLDYTTYAPPTDGPPRDVRIDVELDRIERENQAPAPPAARPRVVDLSTDALRQAAIDLQRAVRGGDTVQIGEYADYRGVTPMPLAALSVSSPPPELAARDCLCGHPQAAHGKNTRRLDGSFHFTTACRANHCPCDGYYPAGLSHAPVTGNNPLAR